jgi:hypothetical protein
VAGMLGIIVRLTGTQDVVVFMWLVCEMCQL